MSAPEYEFVDAIPADIRKNGRGKWTEYVRGLPVGRVARVAIANPSQIAASEYYALKRAGERTGIPLTISRRADAVYVERLS